MRRKLFKFSSLSVVTWRKIHHKSITFVRKSLNLSLTLPIKPTSCRFLLVMCPKEQILCGPISEGPAIRLAIQIHEKLVMPMWRQHAAHNKTRGAWLIWRPHATHNKTRGWCDGRTHRQPPNYCSSILNSELSTLTIQLKVKYQLKCSFWSILSW